MNASIFSYLIGAGAGKVGGVQYEVGLIGRTPVPLPTIQERGSLATSAHRAWSLKRSLDTITETSHAFHLPALLQVSGATLAARAAAWSARVAAVEAELAEIQREIDDIAFHLYGIEGEDRARIEAESTRSPPPAAETDEASEDSPDTDTGAPDDDDEEDDDDTPAADLPILAAELLSWAVGVAFGRFDLRLATGERPAPAEPGPFDPLPACSPGMLTGPNGLPPAEAPPGYPIPLPADGVLVDDESHPADLVARVGAVFAAVFGDAGDARLDEAVRFAGAPDLRTWLRRSSFAFHLKRYSKSRRRAPLWWPLSTASGACTVWLSWPSLTRDTLYSVLGTYVRPRRQHEERRLDAMRLEHGPNPSSRQRAEQVAQEGLVAELGSLVEELERVAPLWNPVHDDGVILHYALLWRMVRDGAWQKECRAAWDRLAAEAYDWAHVAMHLWPERVVPKCRADRSLAIAHGLEPLFWIEDQDGWRPREAPEREVDRLAGQWADPLVLGPFRKLREYAGACPPTEEAWWDDLRDGRRDDTGVALALFPERVFEACKRDARLASRHGLAGLYGASLDAPMDGRRGRRWKDALAARHPAAVAGLVADFDPAVWSFAGGGPVNWPAFWAALDGGALDATPLARRTRPQEVAAAARRDAALARAHGVEDRFFLDGRARLHPDREAADAIAARGSTSVKAALHAFQQAPPPVRAGRGRKGWS